MLMGKGKTSVITPLLIFNYVFNSNFRNIVIVLPKHLIHQTHTLLSNKYSYVLRNTKIRVMKIDRKCIMDEIAEYFSYSNNKNIIITDLTSLQSIRLNSIEKTFIIPFNTNETIFIFDEMDSLSDPMSNELNYPITPKITDDYRKFSQDLIVDIANDIKGSGIMLPIIDDETRIKFIKNS